MAKRAKAQRTRTEQLAALFTEQIVDLDLFTQGDTAYELTDVRGKRRVYRIPNDPPLPVAMAFLRAHDRWFRTVVETAKAKGKAQEALLDKVETAWADLLGRPAEGDKPERPGGFLDLVRILQPDTTLAALRDEIGHAYMANWMDTVDLRLQMARLGGNVLDQLLAPAAATSPKEPPPAKIP